MNNNINIAIITSGYFPVPATLGGAVEALDENLIKQNEISKKVRFTVFSCYDKEALNQAEKYQYSSFEFITIPWVVQFLDKSIYFFSKNVLHKKKSMSYRYILQRLYYISEVSKKLRDNDYDRILLENHATLFMTLKKYSNYKKYNGKYYYHLHNVVTNGYGCDEIIANCKKVIGVSEYINGTLKKYLGSRDNNAYVVLKNKIDQNQFATKYSKLEKDKIRQKYGMTENDVVVLFSGRFNKEKGIKELLTAFKGVKNTRAKLLVVGGYYFGSGMISPFEKEMYELAKDMGERVKFTGFIPYSKMPELYACSDIVVIPSIWDDPAPLTVIEALTSGKALITTKSGGIPEYADSKTSIILEKDETLVQELEKEINFLIENPKERERMEKEVRVKTIQWNIETYYNDFCNIMDILDDEGVEK